LRTRTAVILAASGVVTGFLLGRAAVDARLGAFGYCAVAAFVVSALASVWVLLPRWENWAFSINAKKLMPYFLNEADPEPADALFKYLAGQIQDDYDENFKLLDKLYQWFTGACLALAVEVFLWFLAFVLD